jgi:Xaa-Pro aminopeptidase
LASESRKLRFQCDFEASELRARRERVMEAMGGRGTALLQGAPTVPGFDAFRQTNDFYYLCGVEVPNAYLLIDAERRQSALYLPPRNDRHERSEGPVMSAEDADFVRASAGMDQVHPSVRLQEHLSSSTLLFIPHAPAEGMRMCRDTLGFQQKQIDADPLNGRPSAEAHFIQRVRTLRPNVEVRDLSPILAGMRVVKSAAEVAVMRKAGRLSALAVAEAMRFTKPGVIEYQLGALADAIFVANGARGAGYRAIISGGANIWMGHYYQNDCPLRDGDLVLLDYAPDVGNYTSDIGRMWPVNGRYSPLHRELYGLIVEYHKTLLPLIRPHVTPEAVMHEAAAKMKPVIEGWTFSKSIYRAAALALLDFKGHLSHGVGMSVHEPTGYYGRPLQPGTVFAVDPQMWVQEEQLYIRCEDTVAVTETGCENLTVAAPLELDQVERVMREERCEHAWLGV